MAKILYFQCRGQEFNHWPGNQDPICHLAQPPPPTKRKKESPGKEDQETGSSRENHTARKGTC